MSALPLLLFAAVARIVGVMYRNEAGIETPLFPLPILIVPPRGRRFIPL